MRFWFSLPIPLLLLFFLSCYDITSGKCVQKNCCEMTEFELNSCRGIEEDCATATSSTGSLSTISDKSCAECPAGLCRLNTKCYCTLSFLKRESRHEICEDRYEVKWPQSIGREEIERNFCKSSSSRPPRPSPSRIPSQSPSSIPSQSPVPSQLEVSKDPIDPLPPSNIVASTSDDGSNDKISETRGDLTTLEIVGIVVGIIVGVGGFVLAVFEIFVLRRRRKNQEDSNE